MSYLLHAGCPDVSNCKNLIDPRTYSVKFSSSPPHARANTIFLSNESRGNLVDKFSQDFCMIALQMWRHQIVCSSMNYKWMQFRWEHSVICCHTFVYWHHLTTARWEKLARKMRKISDATCRRLLNVTFDSIHFDGCRFHKQKLSSLALTLKETYEPDCSIFKAISRGKYINWFASLAITKLNVDRSLLLFRQRRSWMTCSHAQVILVGESSRCEFSVLKRKIFLRSLLRRIRSKLKKARVVCICFEFDNGTECCRKFFYTTRKLT